MVGRGATGKGNIELAMTKDRLRKVKANVVEGLSLSLVNSDGVSRSYRELSPAEVDRMGQVVIVISQGRRGINV